MCLQLVRITYHHFFFFFNDTATTEIYTLSLHDALPISPRDELGARRRTGCGSSSRSQADHPPVPDTKARYPSRRGLSRLVRPGRDLSAGGRHSSSADIPAPQFGIGTGAELPAP